MKLTITIMFALCIVQLCNGQNATTTDSIQHNMAVFSVDGNEIQVEAVSTDYNSIKPYSLTNDNGETILFENGEEKKSTSNPPKQE